MESLFVVALTTAFLLWVNVLPAVSSLLWGRRFDRPIDGGRLWRDGHPIFGAHKTLRGLVVGLAGGTALAPVLAVSWWVLATAAGLALLGDLISSFLKRRFGRATGTSIPVLDQFLEGLLPTLFLAQQLALQGWQVIAVLGCFIPLAYLGAETWSYLFYRPPAKNYPRLIRSSVRLREWRACHPPLARWHRLLNFESVLYYRLVMAWCFRVVGLYEQGQRNALDIRLVRETFMFPALPPAFDGFRILLLADLHLDGLHGLTDAIIERVRDLEVDLCLIGGDIRMEMYGPIAPCLRELRRLMAQLRSRHSVLGVLGNHDCIEMVPDFEQAGVTMLINDSHEIARDGQAIWVVGVDDPHYYQTHDLELAFRRVPDAAFVLFAAHSPEVFAEAAAYRSQLYLCGHTHGGQIRLPGWGPVFTHSRAPRRTAAGRWEHQGMKGYTTCGVGASGVPLRFNCPGEIAVITLARGTAQ